MFVYNKRVYFINTIIVFYIYPLWFIWNLYVTGFVMLCDDGVIDRGAVVNGWGGELDGRPINRGFNSYGASSYEGDHPVELDGRDMVNNYGDYGNVRNRYELAGDNVNRFELGVDNNRYEYGDDGTRYIKYGWTDSAQGSSYSPAPAYNTVASTQLGEIEPIGDEVINREYYGVPRPPLDVSKTTLGRKVFNKAKVVVKNRFAKYNEPTDLRRMRRAEYDRQLLQDKLARNAAKSRAYYDKQRLQYEYYDKIAHVRTVRKFD